MAEYDRITLRIFQAQTHDTMNYAAFRAAAAPAALVSMPYSALVEEVVGSAFPPMKKSARVGHSVHIGPEPPKRLLKVAVFIGKNRAPRARHWAYLCMLLQLELVKDAM